MQHVLRIDSTRGEQSGILVYFGSLSRNNISRSDITFRSCHMQRHKKKKKQDCAKTQTRALKGGQGGGLLWILLFACGLGFDASSALVAYAHLLLACVYLAGVMSLTGAAELQPSQVTDRETSWPAAETNLSQSSAVRRKKKWQAVWPKCLVLTTCMFCFGHWP